MAALPHNDGQAVIERIAAAYPEEAAFTPAEERERYFTDAQRQAWSLRFDNAGRTLAR
jgi:hypothetical protein